MMKRGNRGSEHSRDKFVILHPHFNLDINKNDKSYKRKHILNLQNVNIKMKKKKKNENLQQSTLGNLLYSGNEEEKRQVFPW